MNFTKKDLNMTLYMKPDLLEKKRARVKVDAAGMHIGKIAVMIADRLIGKNYAHYCDFWDAGDFVVVDNVDKLTYTGNNKGAQKMYFNYSGYKGNVKSISLELLMKKDPSKVLRYAVRGMLPKNKLRDKRMKRLKIFTGASHKYDALHPQVLNA